MGSKITVCIDIRDLKIAKTGAKTYLEEICRELKKDHSEFSIHFIDTPFSVYTGKNKFLKLIEHLRFLLWKQIALPVICFVKKADILYCTDYFLPLIKLNYKTAVVFYDAFFWEYPEQYNPLWLYMLNKIGIPAAKKADAVITITEYSKQRILEQVNLDQGKVHAIHLAPKSSTRRLNIETAVLDPDKKYILHIGVLEKRKNLLNLIKAFHLLKKEGFKEYSLVLVGGTVSKKMISDKDNIHALIASLGMHEQVILSGFISDEQLAYYYKNASLYAFVSVNEGFGLPILEAFQNHLPTLISDNSCLPEVGGNAVVTCNPYDVNDIKEKMALILGDKALQNELIEKGTQRLASFTWEKTVSSLLEVFKRIV